MALPIAQKTLERLEWPQLVARWREYCRTPQARAHLAPAAGAASGEPEAGPGDADRSGLAGAPDAEFEPRAPRDVFETGALGAREQLARTSEARALLDAEESPPLGGVSLLETTFRRARKGGALVGVQLLEVAATLSALESTRRFLLARTESAPRLADLAGTLAEHASLRSEIETSLDASGEVRDSASPALRAARQEAGRLSSELQRRLDRFLQDSDVVAALSDSYVTLRNDRYVLPVRADMRSKVRGIVHDVSGSGTTLFVEPEAVVELNNRLVQAELSAEREVQRVLLRLSGRVAEREELVRADLATLCELDLAFARGHLSRDMLAVEPEVGSEGIFVLPQLRHPLLPADAAVPNDLRLGESFHVMVISGPNGGGKTVAMKALALAVLCVRAGLHVPAADRARVDWVESLLADIGDDQDIRESLSTFSAHMANLARIVAAAGPRSLVVLDEIGVGTDPSEGAALAQAVLEQLADAGARVIATTHYNLLKEMAAVDSRFCNACVEFDPETLAPTYRLRLDAAGVSSATAVAARMGMPQAVLDRANALLEREDRQLDAMLAELQTSRAALEREQREAEQLRRESEAARNEYRDKLERLQERRDKLYREMRSDLDAAFVQAHREVAQVIRELQRGTSARDAARARRQLVELEQRADAAEEAADLGPSAEERGDLPLVDWRRAAPGDRVRLASGGDGVLESLPDRRGRARVRVGAATVVVEAGQLRAAAADADAVRARTPVVEDDDSLRAPALPVGGCLRCDLRGQRVAEALEQVSEVLDQAAREGREEVRFLHGHGTGALREAIREHLRGSPYVRVARAAEIADGGDAVTVAELRRG